MKKIDKHLANKSSSCYNFPARIDWNKIENCMKEPPFFLGPSNEFSIFDLWSLIINESPCQTCPLKSDVDRRFLAGEDCIYEQIKKREKGKGILKNIAYFVRCSVPLGRMQSDQKHGCMLFMDQTYTFL